MRVIPLVMLAVLVAAPAFAQQKRVPRYGETEDKKSESEIAGEKEADRAYRRSLSNIPDAKPVDPWGGVREAPPAKQSAKSSAPANPKSKASAN